MQWLLLAQIVDAETEAMAGELSSRLKVVEAELADVRSRPEKLYEAIKTSELTLEDSPPHPAKWRETRLP